MFIVFGSPLAAIREHGPSVPREPTVSRRSDADLPGHRGRPGEGRLLPRRRDRAGRGGGEAAYLLGRLARRRGPVAWAIPRPRASVPGRLGLRLRRLRGRIPAAGREGRRASGGGRANPCPDVQRPFGRPPAHPLPPPLP